MTNFSQLAPIIKMLIQAVLMVIFTVDIYMFFLALKYNRRFVAPLLAVSVGNIFLLSVFIADYQCLLSGKEATGFLSTVLDIPVYLLFGFILSVVILTVVCIRVFNTSQKNTVTETSVKQSVDDLPLGICFGEEDAPPILVNRHMRDICLELTGGELQSLPDFWEIVSKDLYVREIKRVRVGQKPIITLKNGNTWSFTKSILNTGTVPIVQIKAVDITNMYELSLRMEQKNKELSEVNRRLGKLKENITETTRDEEILYAKVKIHDDIGNALLSSSRYLKEGVGDPAELLEQWNVNVMLMTNGQGTDTKSDAFEKLNIAARAIGVRLIIDGELPVEDADACTLIAMAAGECITNAVRHADSDEVYIRLYRHIDHYVAKFTNNGKAPATAIREGGGLSGLRRHCELRLCQLYIESNPIFRMTLVIPKKREKIL